MDVTRAWYEKALLWIAYAKVNDPPCHKWKLKHTLISIWKYRNHSPSCRRWL